jgi:hypothetical protein
MELIFTVVAFVLTIQSQNELIHQHQAGTWDSNRTAVTVIVTARLTIVVVVISIHRAHALAAAKFAIHAFQ